MFQQQSERLGADPVHPVRSSFPSFILSQIGARRKEGKQWFFRKQLVRDIESDSVRREIPVCANERITHTGSASMLGERRIGGRISPNKTALSLGRLNQFLPYFFKRGCLPSKYRPIWPKAKQDKRGYRSRPALIVLVRSSSFSFSTRAW